MNQFEKKEVIQAIVIADNNVNNFRPWSDNNSTALLPLVNVPLIDYTLEALNRSGIEEVFIYARCHINDVREHIKQGIAAYASWSVNMKVQVLGGEGARSFGDVMRDLDAKAVVRGNFLLLGADTVTNVKLQRIFEEHKQKTKYDKGTVATIVFKQSNSPLRTGNEVMLVRNGRNQRLHFHQRLRTHSRESNFQLPLEIFEQNSNVELHHGLIDPQIAIGSPAMLALFSDNFDFETRDDFLHGLLINEDILNSRIYVSLLPQQEYAHTVTSWPVYQIVSHDVINRWVYPIVPDMGVTCLYQNYVFMRNNIYKSSKASIGAKVLLQENVVIQAHSCIESGTSASNSVIGRNCRIGADCKLQKAYILDKVKVGKNCQLENCFIATGCEIGDDVVLGKGAVLEAGCVLPAGTKLYGKLVKAALSMDESHTKLSAHAFIIDEKHQDSPANTDSEDEEDIAPKSQGVPKMTELYNAAAESDYIGSSDEDDDSDEQASPIPEDSNIFLSEVLDSLMRGYEEKSNPDFLILEINSSRYAYNMSLQEVNFLVVKAVFGLLPLLQEKAKDSKSNVLTLMHSVFKQLGSVMANYIKTKDAMQDCLKAMEEIYEEQPLIREKFSQVLHYLYDKDYLTEEAILNWHAQLDEEDFDRKELKQSLQKLIEWLSQSSDEEEDDDE